MVGTTLWAFSGLLLGLGVVGFLTGLLLLPLSLLLIGAPLPRVSTWLAFAEGSA